MWRDPLEIEITCRACGREYPLAMAVDPEARPGYCSFCGEVLAPQYASVFVDTAERVLALAPEFLRRLTNLCELAGGFAVDPTSILEPMRSAIAAQDGKIAIPYRPSWPPPKAEPV